MATAGPSTIKRSIGALLTVMLVLSVAHAAGSADAAGFQQAQVAPEVATLLAAAGPDDAITVVVHLRQRASLAAAQQGSRAERQRAVVRALRDTAGRAQVKIRGVLDAYVATGSVSAYAPLWVTDAIVVTAIPAVITELAGRTDVERIAPDEIDIVPTGTPTAPPEPNITQISAPAVWNLGHDGEGVLVAGLDSGVDASHPDLAASYRGGASSWYDPYGQHPSPYDATGHGTATMGVMVGGGNGGTTVGVAPGATWIAGRIFDDSGHATAAAIHQAMQWVLDPDNDPATADAPAVVNNSWSYGTPGCNLEFQADLQAWRAAAIVPVFAAGNYGPGSSTSVSPANYPEAIAVGAVDSRDRIWSGSSRGPAACGQPSTTYPDVVAPGKNIWTTDRNGLYGYWTGTSLSAPAVSGALAVLLSSTSASAAATEAALLSTTADIGAAGPDNTFGHGRIDVSAAYDALGVPPPTTTTVPTTTTTPPTTTTTPPTTTTTPPTTTTTTTVPTTTTTPPATTTTTTVPGPADLVFADGFETGGTGAWSSSVTNGGRLVVAASAALSGQYGLQATISNLADMYVADDSPNAASAYRARFEFDPNSVVIAPNKVHAVFTGRSGAGTNTVVIEVRSATAGYQVRVGGRLNSGATAYSAWATISDAPHAIELEWSSATGKNSKNGAVSLWTDGTAQPGASKLANGSQRVDDARLGPQTIPTGVSGVELFDGFVSTLTSYIGP
jgi:subtilisin family serine protease